jgi:hypothetical protein
MSKETNKESTILKIILWIYPGFSNTHDDVGNATSSAS